MASGASIAEVILTGSAARAGFAGPPVIEQPIRQKPPPGFRTAEFLDQHGHIDFFDRFLGPDGTLSAEESR